MCAGADLPSPPGAAAVGPAAGQDCDIHGPLKPVVAAPFTTSPASQVHVLLVDDERLCRTVVASVLKRCGYRGAPWCGCRRGPAATAPSSSSHPNVPPLPALRAVTSASDGAEALRLLRGSAPDTFQLVLTDVCMPELNGIELLNHVKQDASLRAVPVVSELPGWRGAVGGRTACTGASRRLPVPASLKPTASPSSSHLLQ